LGGPLGLGADVPPLWEPYVTLGGHTAVRSASAAASGHTTPKSSQSARGGATAVGCNSGKKQSAQSTLHGIVTEQVPIELK